MYEDARRCTRAIAQQQPQVHTPASSMNLKLVHCLRQHLSRTALTYAAPNWRVGRSTVVLAADDAYPMSCVEETTANAVEFASREILMEVVKRQGVVEML
mmetsp:Transcript_16916/g.43446  ORF Transcript_16916/g.43446 Transcript_16916/m.43446 type:complete len:100 (-) Transcript_16916:1521-1820(-)